MPGVPSPGQILVGKYRVERVLGVGGMGTVVAATHLHLDERVAIKFLHAQMSQNPEVVGRFLREGKSCIKVRSEHAVKVHDVGTLENGAPYLVMEYLDGIDLAGLLEKQGPMRVPDTVDLILQACEAIAEAHTLGIVHRDLKPANLFLTHRADGSPSIKVLDFGISKASSPNASDHGMTSTQSVLGSPRYMSPEQMRSTRNVDHRTDIWALGVVLYELSSGWRPFDAETMTELCAQILQDSPQSLVLRGRHDIPPRLDATILRCLAKVPDERFANLAELATALTEFASPAGRASAERVVRVIQARGVPAHSGAGVPSRPIQPPGPPGPPDPRALVDPRLASGSVGPHVGPSASVTGNGSVWGPEAPKSSNTAALVAILAMAALVVVGVVTVVLVNGKRASSDPGATAVSRSIAAPSATVVSSATPGELPAPVALAPVAPAASSSSSSPTPAPPDEPAHAASQDSAARPVSAGGNPGNQHPPTPPQSHPAPAPAAGTADMFYGRH